MPGYFYCHHCSKRTRKNPRIKDNQQFCGSQRCQQSRKNLWEREKLKKYPVYYEQRKNQKSQWRKNRPAHQYQSEYRQSHPQYVGTNRKEQILRNKNAQKIALEHTIQKDCKDRRVNR